MRHIRANPPSRLSLKQVLKMLSISNLHVAIGDKPILKGLALDVPAGEVPVLVGPHGVQS